jgi:hypothetical protein
MGEDLEESNRCRIKASVCNLPGGLKENEEKPQSGLTVGRIWSSKQQ